MRWTGVGNGKMNRFAALLFVGLTAVSAAAQPGIDAAPVASYPIVELKGIVGLVRIVPGPGTPYFELKQGAGSTRVYLGAIRYLIAENFNPKTGHEASVRGYKVTDSVVAIEVTLTAEGQALKFRDENGWPLWRCGARRGGRGRW